MSSSTLPSFAPLLVLGAGPAGLAAAEAASAHGHAVTLIDESRLPGGQIWRGGPAQWRDPRAHALWQAIIARPNMRIVQGARIVAAIGSHELLLDTRNGPHRIKLERLIVCSGARELLLPFPGWTLPGVTGAGGLQALIKGGMPVDGKRIVIAGSGPLLLAVAETVRRAKGNVLVIAEHRGTWEMATFFGNLLRGHRGKIRQSLQLFHQLKGMRYRHGATVTAASGDTHLRSVTVNHRGRQIELECDFLACGFGLIPNIELATLLGCTAQDGKVQVDSRQRTSRTEVWAAGELTGIGGVDKALAEGRIAGLSAVGREPTLSDLQARKQAHDFAALLARSFGPTPAMRDICKPDTVVCRCEGVTAGQLSGHRDWRSAKLVTRAGMGPCQGRTCGAACQFLRGWQAPEARLPIFPTSTSILAGEDYAACSKESTP